MVVKEIDQNRRVKAAKNLAESTKVKPAENSKRDALGKQYKVIRQDVLKLRADLAHGYDLVKELIETKVSRRNAIRSK